MLCNIITYIIKYVYNKTLNVKKNFNQFYKYIEMKVYALSNHF